MHGLVHLIYGILKLRAPFNPQLTVQRLDFLVGT